MARTSWNRRYEYDRNYDKKIGMAPNPPTLGIYDPKGTLLAKFVSPTKAQEKLKFFGPNFVLKKLPKELQNWKTGDANTFKTA